MLSNLGKDSEKYLYHLMTIPHDTIKVWGRYIDNKRMITPSEYLSSMKLSLKYEKTFRRKLIV